MEWADNKVRILSGAALIAALVAVVVAAVVVDTEASGTRPDAAGQTPGYTPVKPPTAPPTVRWVGDSYVLGFDASPMASGYTYRVAAALNWDVTLDAEGGTGFIATGLASSHLKAAIGRLPHSAADAPADIVIIDAGRADEVQYPLGKIETALATYLKRLREVYPKAKLVEIVPFFSFTGTQPFAGALARFIAKEARRYAVQVINPNTEGWLPAPKGSTATDKVHPTTAGHAYIAQHLEVDLRQLGLPTSAG